MRIATFNVNSIRARSQIVRDWLLQHTPDVLAVQETKVEDAKFPYADFEDIGYHVTIHGQKSYNGVCLFSREPQTDVVFGFQDPEWPDDCRVMRAMVGDILVINTYVPNGTSVGSEKWDYKLRWLDRFRQYCTDLATTSDRVIWLGDINIAPTPDDVFDSPKYFGDVGHHPDEFSRLEAIVDWGWHDCFRKFTSGRGHFTFWDFRLPNGFDRDLGWRIDHIYASSALVDSCRLCRVDRAPRSLPRPSDHTPLVAAFG